MLRREPLLLFIPFLGSGSIMWKTPAQPPQRYGQVLPQPPEQYWAVYTIHSRRRVRGQDTALSRCGAVPRFWWNHHIGVSKDHTYQPLPLLCITPPSHTLGSGSEDPHVQSQNTVILRCTVSGRRQEDCRCTLREWLPLQLQLRALLSN